MKNVIFPIKTKESITKKIDRWRVFTPVNIIVISYLIVILVGALLLMLPWSTVTSSIRFTDALFTATSATTVTGLVVKETGTYFTFFGQLIILLMIEMGGIGYMAIFGFLIFSGKHQDTSIHHRMLLRETINSPTVQGIRKMAKRIFLFIIFIQMAGIIILSIKWWSDYGLHSIWLGIFHSIAAFNNAGFDILAAGNFQSLAKYATDPITALTIAALVFFGGIGFYVLSDLYRFIIARREKVSYQAKVVLATTTILIVISTLVIFFYEHNNPASIGAYGIKDKLLLSFFHSVTARTAGFSTLNIAGFLPLTIFLIMILMFIGASPGGTGGGVKTTTIAVFWAYIKACVQEKEVINLGSRRITNERVAKAVAITVLSAGLIIVVTSLLVVICGFRFLPALFETVSAFGTVGFTLGITPSLPLLGKYLIMMMMFTGKVGVLALILFISREKKKTEIMLPTGDLTM